MVWSAVEFFSYVPTSLSQVFRNFCKIKFDSCGGQERHAVVEINTVELG